MATSKPLLTKLQEAKRLADATFWQLLDLRIWLNEIAEDELARGPQRSGEPRSGLLGVGDRYADHDDYQPDDRDEHGGDR